MKKRLVFELDKQSNYIAINIEIRKGKDAQPSYLNPNRNAHNCEVLSICGEVKYKHELGAFGQCYDEIEKILKYAKPEDQKKITKILKIWRKYHLNDMQAGTKVQQDALHTKTLDNWASQYDKCCEYLNSINLLEDRGYKFGSKWLFMKLPKRIIKIVEGL